MRIVTAAIVLALVTGAIAATARADGLPLLTDDAGLRGIATPTGFRYVAIGDRDRTLVARIGPHQSVVASRFLPGRFTIPAVAYDGSAGGLSADGKTLVLIRPRVAFPRATTPFVILDPRSFRVRALVTLRGDFSFDAISPDGSTLYFIQYLSRTDPTRYAVRVFDRASGRLLKDPIVDRSEPDEDMRGNPLARVTSRDGRWAYTLYDGAGKTPFIHALDTVGYEAHCIDLDALTGNPNVPNLRLRLTGETVSVVVRGEPLLVVDTKSFAVGEPRKAAVSAHGGWPWLPVAAGSSAALILLASVSLLVRRRRLATT
jgi:hypothetical protein